MNLLGSSLLLPPPPPPSSTSFIFHYFLSYVKHILYMYLEANAKLIIVKILLLFCHVTYYITHVTFVTPLMNFGSLVPKFCLSFLYLFV